MKDFSIDKLATIESTEKGVELPASEVLVEFQKAAIHALTALKALVKNPFLKLIIGIVINAIESAVELIQEK
jgi:hypothetical protein